MQALLEIALRRRSGAHIFGEEPPEMHIASCQVQLVQALALDVQALLL